MGIFLLEERGERDNRGGCGNDLGTFGSRETHILSRFGSFLICLNSEILNTERNTFIFIVFCVIIRGYLTTGIRPLAFGSAWY